MPGRNRRLFIGNLRSDCNQMDLKHFFSKYGRIASIRVVKRPGSGSTYGLIEFNHADDAEAAQQGRAGSLFDRQRLCVEFASEEQGMGIMSPPRRNDDEGGHSRSGRSRSPLCREGEEGSRRDGARQQSQPQHPSRSVSIASSHASSFAKNNDNSAVASSSSNTHRKLEMAKLELSIMEKRLEVQKLEEKLRAKKTRRGTRGGKRASKKKKRDRVGESSCSSGGEVDSSAEGEEGVVGTEDGKGEKDGPTSQPPQQQQQPNSYDILFSASTKSCSNEDSIYPPKTIKVEKEEAANGYY